MTEQGHGPYADSGDELDTILHRATLRPRPSKQAEDRAFAALHAQWQQKRKTRMRPALWMPLGIAAALALAAALFWTYKGVGSFLPGAQVASVARITGEHAAVRNGSGDPQTIVQTDSLSDGSTLTAGPATRIALSWINGGSLRLDENSVVDLVSKSKIRLLAGSIYFDSETAARMLPNSPILTIETSSGSVRHIGTQFMVQVNDTGASISVREGQVRFDGADTRLIVAAGYRVNVTKRENQAQQRLEPYDEAWRWAEQIAPLLQADGQSAATVLDWIARETGREVVYRGQSRRLAQQTVAHGINDVAPANALEALGIATDLRIAVVEGAIEVQERTQ